MKRVLAFACAIFLSVVPLVCQVRTGRTGSRSRANTSDTPANSMILSGKVVLSDGSAITGSAAIQSVCKGQKRTETHTDARGSFSFQFGGVSNSGEFSADTDAPGTRALMGRPERRDLRGCELQASLAGFTSDIVQLDAFQSQSGNLDVGRIVLHRLQTVEGLTISATTAEAPDSARKSWEKGEKQAQQGKLDEAQKSFATAVQLFPKFAAAWFDLGRIQVQQNDLSAARSSFEQSIAADAKYVNPYLGLAQLALRSKSWRELADVSEKILALNPVSFPDAWFWNGVGRYELRELSAAEKSARRGLEVDSEHHIPKFEYLLGVVLLDQGEYPEAELHLRKFLSLATKPSDIAEAQKQLNEIARLTTANVPANEKK